MAMDDAKVNCILAVKYNFKAQVAIEFALAFICLAIFLVATSRVFIWCGNNMVRRNNAFEQSRVAAGTGSTTTAQINFYNQKAYPLNVFEGW